MPKITLNYDKRAFATAIRKVIVVTKKAEVDVVNKALKDVAFRAASFTPKSSVAKINSIPTKMLAALASSYLKKKQGKFTKQEHEQAMRKIMKARRSRIGALRAGWIPAIEALGGTYRGARRKAASSASFGGAIKAIPSRIAGLVANTIETQSADGKHSADEIAVAIAGLERAIEFVALDREDYARRKIEAALQKVSD